MLWACRVQVLHHVTRAASGTRAIGGGGLDLKFTVGLQHAVSWQWTASHPHLKRHVPAMAAIQEAGRHNPVKHDYGSVDKHYEYDLVQFTQPYTRRVGTFFRTAPVAAPRQPPPEDAAPAEDGPKSLAEKVGLPPPAAVTAFSATELAHMSRQHVRQPYDPEGV